MEQQSQTLGQRLKIAQGEGSVNQFISLSSLIAPSIVMGRNGELITTWKAQGVAFETVEESTIDKAVNTLNTLYRAISRSDLAVQIHRIRRSLTDELTECTEEGFAKSLSAKYNQRIGHEDLMATELYLTLILKKRNGIKGIKRSVADIRESIKERVEEFRKISSSFERSLSLFSVKKLGEYTYHNHEFSTQLEFYNFLLTGKMQKVRVPKAPLYEALAPSQVFVGADTIELQSVEGKTFAQCIELKDYVQSTYSGILDGLLYPDIAALNPYVFVETQTFCFLSKNEGTKFLQLQQKQLCSSEDAGTSQIVAISEAIDGVINGDYSMGEYSYTIMVYADDIKTVKKNALDAAKKLQDEGFLPYLSTTALSAAFFSQLPAAFAFRPRLARITSLNFAHLAPLHNFDSGKRDGNPWGESLALLKTPSDQPYYFNFHTSPINEDSFGKKTLGNTTIIGTSGAGKTVLQCFMLAMAQKYRNEGNKMTTVFFDKDRGAEIAIRAMRGGYLAVENGTPTGFNPFSLEPTEDNIQWLISFVKLLLKMDGQPIQTYEELQLIEAVKAVMKMPKQYRRLGLVPQYIPEGVTREEQKNSVSKRLKRWIDEGDLAWVFDNPEDELDFNAYPNFGIDGTDFLDNVEVRTPIAYYLLYRMESVIDGRRFIFMMDEFWKWLLDEAFRDFAFNKLKTIRKQNGLGIFATQSPSDVINSPIAKAVIEQSATQIFLPNPKADAEDYLNGFKVTPTEFEIIKKLAEDSRRMLVKQNGHSAVVELDLGWAKDELFVLSGSTDNIELMGLMRAQYGDNPDLWLQPFLTEAKARVQRSKL